MKTCSLIWPYQKVVFTWSYKQFLHLNLRAEESTNSQAIFSRNNTKAFAAYGRQTLMVVQFRFQGLSAYSLGFLRTQYSLACYKRNAGGPMFVCKLSSPPHPC